jgi:hypothetical protein
VREFMICLLSKRFLLCMICFRLVPYLRRIQVRSTRCTRAEAPIRLETICDRFSLALGSVTLSRCQLASQIDSAFAGPNLPWPRPRDCACLGESLNLTYRRLVRNSKASKPEGIAVSAF